MSSLCVGESGSFCRGGKTILRHKFPEPGIEVRGGRACGDSRDFCCVQGRNPRCRCETWFLRGVLVRKDAAEYLSSGPWIVTLHSHRLSPQHVLISCGAKAFFPLRSTRATWAQISDPQVFFFNTPFSDPDPAALGTCRGEKGRWRLAPKERLELTLLLRHEEPSPWQQRRPIAANHHRTPPMPLVF